jgi:epoxide hydrolase
VERPSEDIDFATGTAAPVREIVDALAAAYRAGGFTARVVDSPAALAAWIGEKYQAWSDNDGDPSSVFAQEEMLDNIMLYWLPAAGAAAARIYWETAGKLAVAPVTVPAGCSVFPREFYRPSRRWAQRVFPDLRYWNELDKGGHFAALEQPEAFTGEVRAAFRAFR